MIRKALLCAVLAAACSRGARKDLTPGIAAEGPEAAVQQAALADPPALTQPEMVEHVLSRVTFGARPEDRARVQELGIAGFVEEQLHPEELDDSALEQRLDSYEVLHQGSDALVQKLVADRKMRQEEQKREQMLKPAPPPPRDDGPLTAAEAARKLSSPPPRPTVVPKEMRKQLGKAGRGPGFDTIAQLSQAKLLRAVASRRQLREALVDFWFNHFNVFAGKDQESALLPEYEERVLRQSALGTFPELLEATAHSPAMLIYLDNWRSASPVPALPPRRWARWLKNNDAGKKPKRGLNENYARELLELHTLGVDGGYTQADIIEVARCFTGWTVEQPQHDPKFVFRPALHDFAEKHVLGHIIAAGHGVEDGEQVLKILEAHPSTARFIARKLTIRFVSDHPPESLVLKVSEAYARTHGDVRSMLRAIFESPEFWSRKALKAKVRSPLELVAAAVRGLGATVDDPMSLARAVARIGEPLYASQPPTGYPDLAQTWLGSGALLARIDFGLQLANGQLEGVKVDLSRLLAPAPDQVLSNAAAELGAIELSEQTRSYILDQLQKSPSRPGLQAARAVGLLLGAPELQRR